MTNTTSPKSSISKILPVLFAFFVMGFCDIVGTASGYVKDAFGWSTTMAGFVPSMVFIWFFFISIPVGIKMNKWGRKTTVQISMVITILGMILPLVIYNSITSMIAFAFLGIGNTILQVSLNPLLNNVINNKKLLTSSLTTGQLIKAISSFACPFIMMFAVSFAANRHGITKEMAEVQYWYYCFPIMGAITLLSSLWLMFTPIPREETAAEGASFGETLSLLKDKTILLLFLGIFFVVGVDVSTNFISEKLMAARFGHIKGSTTISPEQIYFIGRTAGAFIGAFLMTKIAEIKYFRVNIVACIAVLLVLAFVEVEIVNWIALCGIGFFASCVFSIIYSMAVQARPEKANQISGLMVTAIAGGAVIPPVLGFATDTFGMVGGVFVILLCVLYLTYCAFGIKTARS